MSEDIGLCLTRALFAAGTLAAWALSLSAISKPSDSEFRLSGSCYRVYRMSDAAR